MFWTGSFPCTSQIILDIQGLRSPTLSSTMEYVMAQLKARSGELHVPLEVCGAVVKRELDYWHVNQYCIKSCCWRHYRSYIENKAILDSFNRSLEKERVHINIDQYIGWKRFQMKIWMILEHPRTSRIAMIYGIVSLLFVVISILGFCLESLPMLQKPMRNVTRPANATGGCSGDAQAQAMTQNEALNILDIICTVYFTIELAVRFFFAPEKVRFVRSMMNIIDLLALVPLYMQLLIFNAEDSNSCYVNGRLVIEIMFLLRIVRMFRIMHLVKHYQALKILVYALKASVQELLMLAIFLLIGMLVFASMIYYAERKDAVRPSDTFNTIPMGFWWALITMTTVGYGDVFPTQPIGYVVGAACAVSGVLMIALTIPVISNNFTLFYTHVRSRGTKEEERDRYRDSMSTCVNNPYKEETMISHSEEDGYGTISLLEEKRKPSNGSVIETYMNGHATLRNFPGRKSPKYKHFQKLAEATSLNDVIIRNSEFDLHRSNSDKARSDDGVAYAGETLL